MSTKSDRDTGRAIVGWLIIGFVAWAYFSSGGSSDETGQGARAGPAVDFQLVLPGDVLSRGQYRAKAVGPGDIPGDWPFTTDAATLVCLVGYGGAGQFVIVGGRPFAATGATATFAKQQGLQFYMDMQRVSAPLFGLEQPGVEALWREAPRPEGLEPDREWYRVSFGTVITALNSMGCGG